MLLLSHNPFLAIHRNTRRVRGHPLNEIDIDTTRLASKRSLLDRVTFRARTAVSQPMLTSARPRLPLFSKPAPQTTCLPSSGMATTSPLSDIRARMAAGVAVISATLPTTRISSRVVPSSRPICGVRGFSEPTFSKVRRHSPILTAKAQSCVPGGETFVDQLPTGCGAGRWPA